MDQEFDTVSGFLLKRTKDMVNKYRQLLVAEAQVRQHLCLYIDIDMDHLRWTILYIELHTWASFLCSRFPSPAWLRQQDSPSAEMVMLERLFLQAERFSLGEDRRRARRDPGELRLQYQTNLQNRNTSGGNNDSHANYRNWNWS